MKAVAATEAELSELQAVDARLHGLPVRGVLVGNGPVKALSDDPARDPFGWTLWRYAVEPAPAPKAGATHAYPVDDSLTAALADPGAEALLGKAACDAAKALVSKAAAEPRDPAKETLKGVKG